VQIRAPQQYLKTRVYAEGLVEECVYLLAVWLANEGVQGSVAFPEMVVPVLVALRKAVKVAQRTNGSGGGKDVGAVKGLVERIDESVQWVESKRKGVVFAPGKMEEVKEWEAGLRATVEDSPLAKYVKVQRKTRDKRQKLVEKVCEL
jgi:nucleolar complex protein 2